MTIPTTGTYRVSSNGNIQRVAADYIDIDPGVLAGYLAGHFNIPGPDDNEKDDIIA